MVAWVRRKDRQRLFHAVPYQQCPTPPMTPILYQACQSAVHVITPSGRVLRAGRASLFILLKLGYPWWLVQPGLWPPFVWVVEWGYRLVAENRSFFARFMFTRE